LKEEKEKKEKEGGAKSSFMASPLNSLIFASRRAVTSSIPVIFLSGSSLQPISCVEVKR